MNPVNHKIKIGEGTFWVLNWITYPGGKNPFQPYVRHENIEWMSFVPQVTRLSPVQQKTLGEIYLLAEELGVKSKSKYDLIWLRTHVKDQRMIALLDSL
jgi:hypothetical protein